MSAKKVLYGLYAIAAVTLLGFFAGLVMFAWLAQGVQ